MRTAGSDFGMESPRVMNLPGNLSSGRVTRRCRKRRPQRSYKTISPTIMSDTGRLSIETVSPGHNVGSMLVPETRRRQWPLRRNASRINSCLRYCGGPSSIQLAWAIFISNLGVLSCAEMALAFHAAYFAASKSHGLEDAFVAKRRLLIRLFGTTGSSGNGRFGTRPILNLHRPSRISRIRCPVVSPVGILGKVSQKCTPIRANLIPPEGPTDGGCAPTKEPC
jgi:hypothetical protein